MKLSTANKQLITQLVNGNPIIQLLFIFMVVQAMFMGYIGILYLTIGVEPTIIRQLFGIGLPLIACAVLTFSNAIRNFKHGISIYGIAIALMNLFVLHTLFNIFMGDITTWAMVIASFICMVIYIDLGITYKDRIMTNLLETMYRYEDMEKMKETGKLSDITFLQSRLMMLFNIDKGIKDGFTNIAEAAKLIEEARANPIMTELDIKEMTDGLNERENEFRKLFATNNERITQHTALIEAIIEKKDK